MKFIIVLSVFLTVYHSFSFAAEEAEENKTGPGGVTKLSTDNPRLLPALKSIQNSRFEKAIPNPPEGFSYGWARFNINRIIAAEGQVVQGYKLYITFEVTRTVCSPPCSQKSGCVSRKYQCDVQIVEFMKQYTLKSLSCKSVDKADEADEEATKKHLAQAPALGCGPRD